ncbi:MAG: rod shape-determining protein MreC [Butyrivibrio sp.]
MKKKLKNFFTPKVWLTILTCVCFFFIGLTFFTDTLTKPLQKVTSSVIIPLQKGVNGIGLWLTEKSNLLRSLEDLQAENDELRAQIDTLKEENLQIQEDQVELNDLRELYKLDKTYSSYEKVGASVIGRSADNWYNTFTIDKGANDGIEVDMNVISGNGLVGIVTSVSDNYSIVRSIIDDSSNVSSMLLNTGDICTVSGDLQLVENGYISLRYLDKDVRIKDGDMIVTSNISEKYMEGILIGYAKDVSLDSNNLTQSGYVVPAVDFKHIQHVLVILEKKTTILE